MTTKTTKLNGVLLSVLLIVSMVAIGAAGTAGAASDGDGAITESVEDAAGAQSHERADVATEDVPDHEVGDANEDGEIGVQDVVAIQQHLAGLNPDPFNEELADVDRDGEIGVQDLILIQRHSVGLIDHGVLEITDVDAPGEVADGVPFTVTVSLENVGDMGTIQHVNVSLAHDEADLDPADPVATGVADVAPGDAATVDVEVDDAGLVGDLHLGAFTDDDSAADAISIEPAATGVVNGTVVEDVRGDRLEGVDVEIRTAGGVYETTTDRDGYYQYDHVVSGDATVTFSKEGLYEKSVNMTVPEDDTATADAVLEQEPASISGTITASDTGEPIVGASVTAQNDLGAEFEGVTDENGEYTVDDLYAGTYTILVDHGDYRTDAVVHVDYGEDVENVDRSFDPEPGVIEGQVTDVHGEALSDATVEDDHGAFETTTNETGHFRIENVVRGEYAIRATHDDWGVDSGPVFVEVEANAVISTELSIGTFFEVDNFQAPDEAELGETITVSADVTNIGSVIAERRVTYWPPGTNLDGASPEVASESVELKPGQTETVTFEYAIDDDAETGVVEHGISADELASDSIHVLDPDADLASIDLDLEDEELGVDESTPYAVTAHYDDESTEDVTGAATVTSDDDDVASVDEDEATVTGLAEGTATITADYQGESDEVAVTVETVPEPEFDLGEIESAAFDRGETYERTANFTPGDGYDADAEYTIMLEVVGPDGEPIDLVAEEEFTINDVFVPSLGGDAGLIEDDDESGVFYLDESATGTDLNDAGEDEPAEVNATVDADATTGTHTFTVGVVEWDDDDQNLGPVGETASAEFDVVEPDGTVVLHDLGLPTR